MKIAVIANDFKPRQGGIAELSWQLSRGLSHHGHSIHVLTERTRGSVEQDRLLDKVDRVIDPLPSLRTPIAQSVAIANCNRKNRIALTKALTEMSPDAIFCTNFKPYFHPVFQALKIPYFLYVHGDDVAGMFARRNGRSADVFRECATASQLVFFNSKYSRDFVKDKVPAIADRVAVTGCGVSTESLEHLRTKTATRKILGWSKEPVILSVCRQHRRKGMDLVIRALPEISRSHPGCRYVVAGDGPHKQDFIDLAAELGQSANIDFLGEVDEQTKTNLYQAADLFVMPSRPGELGEVEGFGISFLEANANGLAVVGSDVGGIPDAVQHGVNGELVPPNDVSAVADAIVRLLLSPRKCNEMAVAGRQRIIERYNWTWISGFVDEQIRQSLHPSDLGAIV
ncbi:GDP-mannose-dependent alpha-(1-6)-phosphatidylinositol monomannoside mannosyltransferase [Novipirellula aureliae]|uniref:GDP-mannose-dependent alpha-(1-6)-phosphatidylinositol monomannoside mannosyltransferase n=1 Tax=Novipirellula aureliae TaxID=2527966 RepID=A0A5C6DZU0_9BACT|nr:glycosyltransferase family 4 protein [Novipirellula aureliae]TWU41297.1 GDP-mannose-dependent alpha-(1-6)-phosphatidylinositol monomannoside mannosyltransferase [Novipirellula aureliae]